MSPLYRVLPPNDEIIWLNRTRLSQSANFAFAASKRTAKTAGISTERNAVPVGRRFAAAAMPLRGVNT